MDQQTNRVAVTGVLGYSGKYMARNLESLGIKVIGLTNSLDRENPMQYELHPLDWGNLDGLAGSMEGCDALINTYWVRFNHRGFNHEQAVAHTKVLFEAARQAGVKRIVHVSITNPDVNSPLSYFKGKAELESALLETGIPYSILRPAMLFGGEPGEDILLNNMAWALRHFPVVGVFGKGDYKMQPIHVEDFAELAVREVRKGNAESVVIDAIGSETYTFKGLFEEIGKIIGHKRPVLPMPTGLAYRMVKLAGNMHHDVMLTRDEVTGLMENRLYAPGAPPAGPRKLSDWVKMRSATIGCSYASELSRRK